ncbi:hypothetical protein B0J12DRAFT_682665 [Macrophomina phaseolina]|uniref:Uncharacterized protein n=1 Tax=Macrophomina phaseolina TaxID=35725 RepID=A0ABQ8FVE3_9PEZI|nr:hypothetical protein B0J12DRAFT_682665 [Macrophomina phaseolina]
MGPPEKQSEIQVNIYHNIPNLGRDQKIGLLQKIWPEVGVVRSEYNEQNYKEFFGYLSEECKMLDANKSEFVGETLDAHLPLLEKLGEKINLTQKDLVHQLQKDFPDTNPLRVRKSLELISRILLTLNIRSPGVVVGRSYARERKIEWPVDSSLVHVINQQFQRKPVSRNSSVPDAFSAARLKMMGIQIEWTNNLADHLLYDENTVWVYQHKVCLWNHTKQNNGAFQKKFLLETIDTLNLLFPANDKDTERLLKMDEKGYITGQGLLGRGRKRNIEHYEYWGENLQALVNKFDSGPRHMRKALFWTQGDTLGRLNLWITLLVALLTVVTIAFGGAQVAYAVKQYKLSLEQYGLAVKQYDLDRAEICSRNNLPEQLQRVCA